MAPALTDTFSVGSTSRLNLGQDLCLFSFMSWNLASSWPNQMFALSSFELCLPCALGCQGLLAGEHVLGRALERERASCPQDLLRSQKSE